MAGQITPTGAEIGLNHLAGLVVPNVGASAPTYIPGLYWIDSGNSYAVKGYNGSSWVTTTGARYLCLLSSDPTGLTAVNQLTEIQTAGYARQLISFANATAAYPSVLTNSSTITFGPFTADMVLAAGWLAMVSTSSGTNGHFLYGWTIKNAQKVASSQSIQIETGALALSTS